MTPEEYQRFKEAEKQHLRKLKELKKAVGKLEREKSIRTAFENVSAGPTDVLNRQKDLVDQLAIETAQHEARLDMALESSKEAALEAEAAGLEEELQRDRAQALVRQLKRELEDGEKRGSVEGGEHPIVGRHQRTGSESNEAAAEEGGTTSARRGGEGEKRRDESQEHDRRADFSGTSKVAADPTPGRGERPEKTIGRM